MSIWKTFEPPTLGEVRYTVTEHTFSMSDAVLRNVDRAERVEVGRKLLGKEHVDLEIRLKRVGRL